MEDTLTRPEVVLFELSNYVRPKLVENRFQNWVLNGRNNSFYYYIIDRFNGSPTNAAIINSYTDLIYGNGLSAKNTLNPDWLKLKAILKTKDIKRIVADFQLYGEASFEVIRTKGKKLSSISHVPKEKVAPSIADDNVIESYWICNDWAKTTQNRPEEIPSFSGSNNKEIYVIRPYKAGKEYFSDPDYLAAMPYCEMEEEIANMNINSIKNGLSAGYIINVPDGKSLSIEEKDNFEQQIKSKLTGSPNASRFILSFNGRDVEITVTPFPVNEQIHKQWEFLVGEARQQIITGHRLTSPTLAGISTASGFSSTSDEMDMAESQLMKRVIKPKQNYITEAFQEVLEFYGMNLDLHFIPLTEKVAAPTELKADINLSLIADELIALGEDLPEDYDIIEEERCEQITLKERDLNIIFNFAQVPVTPRKKSDQDTSLFKIRYKYAGSLTGQREFCSKVLSANKIYRAEDLDFTSNYNEDFAPKGRSGYNTFLYKGGVNCKHWWSRVILLKKDNSQISVNQARKMILELDPKDRKNAQWEQNPKEVATIADASNNYWSLTPGYRQ